MKEGGNLKSPLPGSERHVPRRRGPAHPADAARALYASIPSAVVVMGRDGHVIHANAAAEDLLGKSLERLRGRSLPALHAMPLDKPVHGHRFELRRNDGRNLVLRLDSEPVLGADGEPFQIVANLADVTADARIEREFRAVFDGAGIGMLRVDLDGSILEANQAVLRLLDRRARDLVGRPFLALFRPEDAAELRLQDLTEFELGSLQADLRLADAEDPGRWVRTVTTAVLDSRGKPAFLISTVEDVSREKAREVELEHRVLHDSLTGLPNRSLLQDRLRHAIQLGQREAIPFALFLMDLDRFKEVNDTFGHHTGDELLVEVARRLTRELRASDTIARLGGDEFAAILPGIDDTAQAEHAASKLLRALNQPFEVGGERLTIAASIGIVLFPEQGTDADGLMRRADVAMYVAKRAGGGSRFYAADQDTNSPRRLTLMADLRDAILHNQLALHYQPKVDLRSGEMLGVEALVRWLHPDHGVLAPDRFLPLAEQSGLIVPLGRWVINEAIRQCARWRGQGATLKVALNLSARSLQDRDLPDFIGAVLRREHVDASLLQVEITESTLMADPALAAEVTERLSDMGVQLAIDDFGVGYSSLAYVGRLHAHEIKIDKSFVLEMARGEKDAVIVQSTIELGRSLGLRVVAEGVEDERTWEMLVESGCEVAQGFLFSKPLPAADILAYVKKPKPKESDSDQPGGGVRRPAFSFDEVNRRQHVLQQVSLFFGLPDDQLRAIARRMQSLQVGPSTEIIGTQRGQGRLFVIEDGACQVVEEHAGKDLPLVVIGRGDVVGAHAMSADGPSGFRVIAQGECRLLGIDRDNLAAAVSDDSPIFEHLRQLATQRRETLGAIAERARAGEHAGASVVSIYSPKGGSGKSTVAVNLAAELAKRHHDDVLLFDLSLPYNHAALLANTTPSSCLARMSEAGEDAFPLLLRGAIARHPAGFMVLSTALRAEEADLITPELVIRAVRVLGAMFTTIVFDLGVALTDAALTALELSHHVGVVTGPELASLKDGRQFLGILNGVLRLPAGRMHVVVNHRAGKSTLPAEDIEALLGHPVAVVLPFDGDRPERAALAGKILAVDDPRDPFAQGCALLARRLEREVVSAAVVESASPLPFALTQRLVVE
ncbi:MAG TPA: EAL domain-containing protein [Candidatus Dormibacteraeota bacterium]